MAFLSLRMGIDGADGFFRVLSEDSRASTKRSAFLGSVILTCVKMLEVAIAAPSLELLAGTARDSNFSTAYL